ncbi:hypothetical protein LC612_43475 [Nostoc sp. CHAB 5834]|nr:hypothetical protein [Nostoc sp. CHAB 5834]
MSDKKDSSETKKNIGAEEEKTCFVIMPISDNADYETGHFQRVYEYIIKPACKNAGFKPTRADDVKSSNVIIIDILERILNSDMVVCDLSSKNPNVLYELGIRQAFDLPVTLIKDDITERIFDIQTFRDVPYHSQLRIDQVDKAIKLLQESIRETFDNKGKEVNSIVELLGRTKAKIKPTEISNDTIVLLQAIDDLNRKVGRSTEGSIEGTRFAAARVTLPNSHEIQIGDRIQHRTFGGGTLRKIILDSNFGGAKYDGLLTIDFDKFGQKAVTLSGDGMLIVPELNNNDSPF